MFWNWKGYNLFLCLAFLIGCGDVFSDSVIGEGEPAEQTEGQSSENLPPGEDPFDGATEGDLFPWGKFIRLPYQSTHVESLPIPVFLAYFNAIEEREVLAGIDMANRAVGFEVFEAVDTFTPKARVIYKVQYVSYEDPSVGIDDFELVIGYTYNRNIYMADKYDAGRVVTDWATEIRSDAVDRFVVAHELGHAMGIQQHALIDYENDTVIELEENSLMAAAIGPDPAMHDYETMMERQGEILLDYMDEIDVDS